MCAKLILVWFLAYLAIFYGMILWAHWVAKGHEERFTPGWQFGAMLWAGIVWFVIFVSVNLLQAFLK